MNVSDSRSISEQIRSGIRLAGWVLFSLAFIFLLLGCATSLLGDGNYNRTIHRVIAACVLAVLCAVMFLTVKRWVKWFIGFLGYFVLKAGLGLVLGFTPTSPAIAAPRMSFLGMLASLLLATVLCTRYLTHDPRRVETLGLVGLVIALCFSVISNSTFPLVLGIIMLLLLQLAQRMLPHLRPLELHRRT